MQYTATFKYRGFFVAFLWICCLIKYTTTHDTNAERSTVVFPIFKDGINMQESERDFTEFTTLVSRSKVFKSTETPSITVSRGRAIYPESARKQRTVLTACFGVIFVVFVSLLPECLKKNSFCDCGPVCQYKCFKPPETVAYSVSETMLGSLHWSID